MSRNYGIPNPEAPLDGLNDHWDNEPPSNCKWWLFPILVIAAAFVLMAMSLYAFSQEGTKFSLEDVRMGLTIFTGPQTPKNIDYGESVADIDACFEEAKRFLKSLHENFPEGADAVGIGISCRGKLVHKEGT